MMMQKKKVIIDCDPGHDDAAAIILAARSPELELIGITCVAGNVEVEKTSMNALKLCGLAGIRKVPVVRGMAKPMFSELQTASAVHGKSGLDGVILPPTDLQLYPGHAVDFLVETLLASNNDITLIPTAPLTNIAMAMLREPRIIPRVAQIVLMGGAMGLGNVTPSAEFNIYTDPEAAKVVFESGAPIVMVGLDATHKAPLRQEHLNLISRHGTPVSVALTSMFRFYLGAVEQFGIPEYAALHDACAVASVCDPSLLKTQLMRVDIEIKGELTRGRTVCDPYLAQGKPPNVHVGVDFDAERFFAMLIERLK
ncbi:MAG: nucleoside hydrolase [Candidatus Vecturithrix sp.]|jgi:inosine-uridine nucleoside N-ribohydrolase|nr:nucleoside hydrolase [Candidatus Vecturithrix sp.]